MRDVRSEVGVEAHADAGTFRQTDDGRRGWSSGRRGLLIALIGCVLGSILYRIAIQLALSSDVIGLQASDLNFVTAVLVTFALILPRLRRGAAS